jgi:hypothetical protein
LSLRLLVPSDGREVLALPFGELKRSQPFDAGVCVLPVLAEEFGRSLKPLLRALLGKLEFAPRAFEPLGRFTSPALPRGSLLFAAPNEELVRPASAPRD